MLVFRLAGMHQGGHSWQWRLRFRNLGSPADEGVYASEMSAVLQLRVHKLTGLKIVENIQSMREGAAAALSGKGSAFSAEGSPLEPAQAQHEAQAHLEGAQTSASSEHHTRRWRPGERQ